MTGQLVFQDVVFAPGPFAGQVLDAGSASPTRRASGCTSRCSWRSPTAG